MTPGKRYRLRAAEMCAKADEEVHPLARLQYENLALRYFLLAARADRNGRTDVVYESPLGQSERRKVRDFAIRNLGSIDNGRT